MTECESALSNHLNMKNSNIAVTVKHRRKVESQNHVVPTLYQSICYANNLAESCLTPDPALLVGEDSTCLRSGQSEQESSSTSGEHDDYCDFEDFIRVPMNFDERRCELENSKTKSSRSTTRPLFFAKRKSL